MDYGIEKLNKEYNELRLLWNKLKAEWEKPSDWEDLYRVYPLLTTTAAIARKYIHWDKSLNNEVKVIKPSLETNIDTSDYLNSDEKSFFNGVKENKKFTEVAGLFLHQIEYNYMDDRKSDGKITNNTTIYIYVRSDILCKSCALVNNGEYKEGKKNYKKTTAFVKYPDCTCGIYVNIDSYLDSIEQLINKKK